MPSRKRFSETHTAPTKFGSGDYYGVGVRNPMAKIKSWSMGNAAVPAKDLKKKPKALA